MKKVNFLIMPGAPIYLWKFRNLGLLFLALMFGLTYLIYDNYTCLQTKLLLELQKEEIKLKQSLSKNYQLLKGLPAYHLQISQLAMLTKQVRLPSPEELTLLIIQINQLAEDNNIEIKDFSPVENTKNQPPAKKSNKKHSNLQNQQILSGNTDHSLALVQLYQITLVTGFKNLLNFIYQLAKLKWVISIYSIDIQHSETDNLKIKLGIKIFYRSF